jgi:hypothetical protein
MGAGAASAATTATPWVTAGLGAVNIGMSLVEASKQKDLQRSAQRAAEQASAEQKRIQSQNFFEALQVPTEAYEREFREGTAQQMQAVSALQEADPRMLAAGIGKVQAVASEQAAKTREDLAAELFDLEKLQAIEQGQTADQMAAIYGQELTGAQRAEAIAENTRMAQLQNALGAGAGILTGLTGNIPEYSNVSNNPTGNGSGMNLVNKEAQSPISQRFIQNQSPYSYGQPSPYNPFPAGLQFLNK